MRARHHFYRGLRGGSRKHTYRRLSLAASTPLTAAEQLRRQADILLDLADRYETPSRSTVRLEALIADVEQAADDVRAVARGRTQRLVSA